MTPEMAEAIATGLKSCAPRTDADYQMEEAVMWVLYEVWSNFSDRYFSTLDGTWAGEVLDRMRAHYRKRQEEARRIHAARQIKKRDRRE